MLGGALLGACRTAPPERSADTLHAAWSGGEVDRDLTRVHGVYVAPVDVSRVGAAPWFRQAERSGDVGPDEVRDLTAYAEERLRAAFRAEGFVLVASPGPETLVVELAVTELTPAHDWLATLASAPEGASRGHIGVVVRWRVRGSGVLASFSATGPGPALVVGAADFSWWGHARGPLDAWARELARLARAHVREAPGPLRSAPSTPATPRPGARPRG